MKYSGENMWAQGTYVGLKVQILTHTHTHIYMVCNIFFKIEYKIQGCVRG